LEHKSETNLFITYDYFLLLFKPFYFFYEYDDVICSPV
jgi:hypothetical protein